MCDTADKLRSKLYRNSTVLPAPDPEDALDVYLFQCMMDQERARLYRQKALADLFLHNQECEECKARNRGLVLAVASAALQEAA